MVSALTFKLKFVILLNFGSHFDPLQYLEVEDSTRIFIVDSHRPVLLENCYLQSNVSVWDDGELEKQAEVETAYREWHEEDVRQKQAGDSDDDLSDDNEETEEAARSKRRSRSRSVSDEDSDSGMSSGPRQRRKTSITSHVQPSPRKENGNVPADDPRKVALDRRRKHERNGSILAEYYDRGDYYRESVACLIYGLATDLGREDNDLLWFAIVGLTSMSIQNRITTDDYSLYYSMYKDEVNRLNPPPVQTNGISRANGRNSNDSSIRAEAEYRFMLYRHWSLYDAMLHSPYLGARMKIYSEPGKKQLHKLFAKMGFSLTQCRQIYTHMDMDLKRNLREKLAKFAPQYGLDELLLKSFVRAYGYKCTLSASDTSYAITALIEAGRKGIIQRNETMIDVATDNDIDKISEIQQEWLQNFNDAFDALDNIDLLQKAIPISMSLHQAIVRTGTALIDKREIRSLRSFRMTVVKEGPDVAIFTHPLALSKLALWIAEAINESEREKGKTKHLPFVIAALDQRTDRYLVLGTSVTHTLSHDNESQSRNKFGAAFQALSTSHQARFRLDSFDASVVECNKADLGQLLETLSLQVL